MSTFKKALVQLHVFVFLAGLTGSLGFLIKLNGLVLVFYRILITVIVLWVLALFRKNIYSYNLKTKFSLLGTGAIIALHWVCFYQSIKLANVSIALVCFSSTSLFSSFLEPLWKHAKIQFQEILIGSLSLLGILLIFHFDTQFRTGIIVGLFSALFAAIFSIINKRFTSHIDVQTIQSYEMTGGLLFLLPFVLLLGFNTGFNPMGLIPTPMDWFWLSILAIACTVWSTHLMLSSLKHISAFTLNVTLNLEPVYGIILAFILFKEQKQLGLSFYAGILCIIISVIIQMRRIVKQHRTAQIKIN
ncbi:MAG: EamA family transporter [Chitinophagaceae bacterium]|nr:EamA family transporter [Chitinophagaceae bacterium]